MIATGSWRRRSTKNVWTLWIPCWPRIIPKIDKLTHFSRISKKSSKPGFFWESLHVWYPGGFEGLKIPVVDVIPIASARVRQSRNQEHFLWNRFNSLKDTAVCSWVIFRNFMEIRVNTNKSTHSRPAQPPKESNFLLSYGAANFRQLYLRPQWELDDVLGCFD